MKVQINVDSAALREALARLSGRVRNLGPLLREVGEDIVTRTKARFGTGTGPDGVKWKPKQKKDGRPTLVGETGNLRRQIISSVAGNTLTVSATMGYAAAHQFGAKIDKGAQSRLVRHRTDAKGELLRTKAFNGNGLVFAKDSHKRARSRWFEQGAHTINIPARPFLPVRANGTLYPADEQLIARQIADWLTGPLNGPGGKA